MENIEGVDVVEGDDAGVEEVNDGHEHAAKNAKTQLKTATVKWSITISQSI